MMASFVAFKDKAVYEKCPDIFQARVNFETALSVLTLSPEQILRW